ncbi:MAG: hypothetical protein KA116_02420 [Proteobacteria bacterium]|nr:hypothetical protein [Pseudomonadota bacterium]
MGKKQAYFALSALFLVGQSISADSLHNAQTENRPNILKSNNESTLPNLNNSINSNKNSSIQSEAQIEASLKLFWQMSQGKKPSDALLREAKIETSDSENFLKNLSNEEKLNSAQQKTLRANYNEQNRSQKFKARKKFINFVSVFQEKFPAYASILPEALTAWGETRNLGGLMSEDSLLLQAKMASVIQVLRNRTQKNMNLGEVDKALSENKTKWQVATQRFQFTSFEPFDPNLAEVALGPKMVGKGDDAKLKVYDQAALKALARVLFRMSTGDIEVPKPLNEQDSRHYMTPSLLSYSRKKELELKELYKKHPRLKVLRIPQEKPKFLALVPRWSAQDALITHPIILLRELTSSFMEQEIPPKDFIFFQGIL